MRRGISSSRADPVTTAIKVMALITVPIALALVPLGLLEQGPTVCVFHNLTGHDCPGCGMTRSLVALLHGDAVLALAYNKGIIIVAPLLLLLWGKQIRVAANAWMCGRRDPIG